MCDTRLSNFTLGYRAGVLNMSISLEAKEVDFKLAVKKSKTSTRVFG
jgi:hypothetical protein